MNIMSQGASLSARRDSSPKVLCILTRLLGGRSFSEELRLSLARLGGAEFAFMYFDGGDYSAFPAPWAYRLSASLEAGASLARKLKHHNVIAGDFDALLFQSAHLTLPFASVIAKRPTVISLDSTPRLGHAGNIQSGRRKPGLRNIVRSMGDRVSFQRIFRNVDFFLARTEAVANSLREYYGIPADKIAVTYFPVPLNEDARPLNSVPRLLFVGNDFDRKGGPFILDTFRHYVRSPAELIIVSTDKAIERLDLPPAVKWIPGLQRDELLNLYAECDLFLFPTWKDDLGLALCEAIGSGLPAISRDTVGGQKEVVRDGVNGCLLPYSSTPAMWGTAIDSLLQRAPLLARYSEASLVFAKHYLNRNTFDSNVQLALTRLVGRS